jgi:hypothetical protein
MSSGGGGSKQESIENYEKEYLERLEREKKSTDLQTLIFKMAEEAKVHVAKDYIGFCAFCTMGVSREEMVYQNNLLFHSNCFEQQGKNFPAANKDLATRQASAKIELVQLKNLKIRTTVSKSTPRSTPRHKTKAKKKKMTRRKKPTGRKTRRKPIRRKTKRRPVKKRKAPKRQKNKRVSRTKSKRRPSRRSSRRRTKRSSSRRRRR